MEKYLDELKGKMVASYKRTKSLMSYYDPDDIVKFYDCLLYTSPSPRDRTRSRMPSSA